MTITSLENDSIYTPALGVSRSLLALGTLISVYFQDTSMLVNPGGIYDAFSESIFYSPFNLYLILDENTLHFRIIAAIILTSVFLGYLQGLSSVLYLWLSFSIGTLGLIEGGDQISFILAFLLVPICLADPRSNHWIKDEKSKFWKSRNIIGNLTRYVIKIQMSILYFVACTSKLNSIYWLNGTVLYYWFNHNIFGAPDTLIPILNKILHNGVGIFFLTWSVLILELLLSAAIFMKQKYKIKLLVCGIFFHTGIGVIHGLVSFAIAMISGLVLYLYDFHKRPKANEA